MVALVNNPTPAPTRSPRRADEDGGTNWIPYIRDDPNPINSPIMAPVIIIQDIGSCFGVSISCTLGIYRPDLA